MIGVGLYDRPLGRTARRWWFDAPAYADLCAIADLNRWRFAIPAAALADIPAATAAQLCVKRPCTDAEFFAFTCSSTGARTYTDATGTLRADLAVDQLRKDRINGRLQLALNGPSTNGVPNNMMVNASIGNLPDKWYWGGGSGVSGAVVGLGTEDGITYIDVAVSGTAAASSQPFVFLTSSGSNHISAADGQTWTQSTFMRVLSGAAPPGLGTIFTLRDTSLVALTAIGFSAVSSATSLGASRIAGTATINNAATAYVQQRYVFNLVSGTTYNFVVRIGLPQLEQQPFASPPIPTFANAVVRAIESARFSPIVEAVLQRSAASIVVRGQNMQRPVGRIIGGSPGAITGNRLIGSNSLNITAVVDGTTVMQTTNGANYGSISFGVAMGFDGAGRSIVRNGVPLVSDTGNTPGRTSVWLGRGAVGEFADGWYDSLEISPQRLSNARLTERAVPA